MVVEKNILIGYKKDMYSLVKKSSNQIPYLDLQHFNTGLCGNASISGFNQQVVLSHIFWSQVALQSHLSAVRIKVEEGAGQVGPALTIAVSHLLIGSCIVIDGQNTTNDVAGFRAMRNIQSVVGFPRERESRLAIVHVCDGDRDGGRGGLTRPAVVGDTNEEGVQGLGLSVQAAVNDQELPLGSDVEILMSGGATGVRKGHEVEGEPRVLPDVPICGVDEADGSA